MKAAIIVFPGSNCDRDVKVSLEQSMGSAPIMAWHGDAELPNVDLIVVPGGFSYGDYLRSGAMAAHSPIMRKVADRANKGIPILGICNGFQILTEAGLLPGTLMRNASLKFICRDVYLRVEASDELFNNSYGEGQVIRIPIAHHDGNYFADDDTLKSIEDRGQVAYRYCNESGEILTDANPNGSLNNIAGVFNDTGNVLGMMPHPERLADSQLGGTDGKPLFDGLIAQLS